jgi:long-chain acyl-CoA synthetase
MAMNRTDNPVVCPGETVPELFLNAVKARGDKVWMREKDLGIWRGVSWNQLDTMVREVAMGLVALGLQPGECVSILANTTVEWVYADLGALCAGGVSSGIYPTDAPSQVEYLLSDSATRYVFVEDDEQLDKILLVRSRIPDLRKIIVFDMEGLRDLADPQVTSLDALRELGREYAASRPGEFERRAALRRPSDLAILVYTSGTTGKPKGAMLSHHNIIFSIRGFNSVIAQTEDDERMAFLPMCHVAERLGGVYYAMYTGTKLNFVENPDTVPENVREIAPTRFAAVPRVWEKFYSVVMISLAEGTRLQRWAYGVAIAIGRRVADKRIAGKFITPNQRIGFWLARFLVLDNVRKMIGVNRARFVVTGAAPISPDLIRWYMALGVDVIEVYGQTECSALATAMPPDRIRPGTVGPCVGWGELKLSPEGEILVRGEHVFMGYLNQPEKTAEALRDGWLHTGDVGTIDDDGFVRITDRMKDIIITAGGKNITPSEIENQLKFSPYITDAVVIGDKRAYLTCLVMIDHDNVEQFAQAQSIPFGDYTSLCRAPAVQELIQSEIDKVNQQFARVEGIKKFRLIEQKLGAEDEELTPTMKLKRKLVNEKYRQLIDGMYGNAA